MKLIAVCDKKWGIGKQGKLLCHLPGDLKYFKENTLGKTLVMGRKTLESLPQGKPLPGRKTVILTGNSDYRPEECAVCSGIDELLSEYGKEDLIVAGGGQIYEQLLKYCDTCLITKIDGDLEADVFLPDLDKRPEFELTWQGDRIEENGITYRFTKYERVNNG